MAGKRYDEKTKLRALKLIRLGKTYTTIQKDLEIPKSTLSVWANQTGKPRDRTRQLAHLKTARMAAAAVLSHSKSLRLAEALRTATQLVDTIPLDTEAVRKPLLAVMYWAEGGKQDGNMKFTNTDPDLLYLFISLLRAQYPIDEKRLHIALQLHHYHNAQEELDFWSKKLNIPIAQFWKIYRKSRGGRRKYRRNSHGICNLHYSSTSIQRELIAIGHYLALRMNSKRHVNTYASAVN